MIMDYWFDDSLVDSNGTDWFVALWLAWHGMALALAPWIVSILNILGYRYGISFYILDSI
jgi:hypothetical protein